MTPANGRLRDLVVEDEFVIADTLAAILKSIGFDAAPIYSGNVAVANARDSGLGSLVCDTILDGVSGIETAIQIRAIVECPANFEPVCMRETGAKGAGDGTRKEAYA